jgi:hypothetical protein
MRAPQRLNSVEPCREPSAASSRWPGTSRRRFALILGAGAVVVILATTLHHMLGKADSFPAPTEATLAHLSMPQRIVALAESQVGYGTQPSDSYCNKFSAYWEAGTPDCPSGERAEEWCADFAAWVWQKAGVQFNYGYGPGEINGGVISLYEWGVAIGEWHPATAGYVASPGDLAIYGLALGADPSAAHVAIVTDDAPDQSGPDVVNGDGDQTGFSRVETETNQLQVEVGQEDFALAGYVRAPAPSALANDGR